MREIPLGDGAEPARVERPLAEGTALDLGQLRGVGPADVAAARALGGLDVAPDVVAGGANGAAAEALDGERVHAGTIGFRRARALP